MKASRILWGFCICIGALASCKSNKSVSSIEGSLQLAFTNTANNQPLQFSQPYVNAHGEPYTVSQFAYYVSHFELENTEGVVKPLPVTYHLIDEKRPETRTLNLKIPEGNYRSIRMLIGVDSTRNVSGIQSGDLDPARGMFWSWNTGYIFAKLEGKSTVSPAPLQNITYHIGGFKQAESALQMVNLTLPSNLQITTDGQAVVSIEANIDAWFTGKHDIKIATEAFSMNPGELAMKVSENYAAMFTVKKVEN